MPEDFINIYMTGPDEQGRFGKFGGRFVSETLMPRIQEMNERYTFARTAPSVRARIVVHVAAAGAR